MCRLKYAEILDGRGGSGRCGETSRLHCIPQPYFRRRREASLGHSISDKQTPKPLSNNNSIQQWGLGIEIENTPCAHYFRSRRGHEDNSGMSTFSHFFATKNELRMYS